MPKYFFSLEGGPELPVDAYGEDHPDDESACAAATQWCRELVAEGITANWNMDGWVIVVSTGGRVIAKLPVEATLH